MKKNTAYSRFSRKKELYIKFK